VGTCLGTVRLLECQEDHLDSAWRDTDAGILYENPSDRASLRIHTNAEVVDQVQQMHPVEPDALKKVILPGARLELHFLEQDVGEAQNRIERCPELVAHPAEKFGLGPVGIVGLSLGFIQLGRLLLEAKYQLVGLVAAVPLTPWRRRDQHEEEIHRRQNSQLGGLPTPGHRLAFHQGLINEKSRVSHRSQGRHQPRSASTDPELVSGPKDEDRPKQALVSATHPDGEVE